VYSYDPASHVLVYKPVARKVHLVIAPLDEEFHITRTLPDNLIARLVPLPLHPLDFVPGECFTQEHADSLGLDPTNWLWLDKVKLVRWIVCEHEKAFAWVSDERGCLNEKYFPPVKIPTIPHIPWVMRNIPVPPAMWADTIQIIKDRISSGVYEPSAATYHSRWFCILKQDG
jgi:hypothetical protein